MGEEDSDVTKEAVQPILDSIALGRTDIIKTVLDEVKSNLQKHGDNPSETGETYSQFHIDTLV